MQEEQLYHQLAERLNACVIGAPKTDELLEILKTSYAPNEIRVTQWLSFTLEDFETIARRAELETGDLKHLLETLVDKGLVYRGGTKEKPTYCLFPTVVGFFETAFWAGRENPATTKLAKHWLNYYYKGFGDEATGKRTALTRVVPVEQSIANLREVVPWPDSGIQLRWTTTPL